MLAANRLVRSILFKIKKKNEQVHFPRQQKTEQKENVCLFYHRKPVPRARLNRQYISITLIIPPAISSGVRTKSASYMGKIKFPSLKIRKWDRIYIQCILKI